MPVRQSFASQIENQRSFSGSRRTSSTDERLSLAMAVASETDEVTKPFTSKFAPTEMRQLALVAHNHMKPAMKQFIDTYSEILKKFRITGTQTTMKMCKSMWGEDDPSIHYGLTCTSGPLGGDAQIAALMCMEDLGGMIFFIDPLSAHPHQADIDSLQRLANCGNIIVCSNPASASSMMYTLRTSMVKGSRGMIPSFFETLESPAVEEYKHQQAVALANVIKGDSPSAPAAETAETFVLFGEETPVQVEEKKDPPSRRTIDQALMGESMMFSNKRLQALLAVNSDIGSDLDDDDDDDDDNDDSEKETPAARVSYGLFGIKTKTKRRGKRPLKKLGKSVRKLMGK